MKLLNPKDSGTINVEVIKENKYQFWILHVEGMSFISKDGVASVLRKMYTVQTKTRAKPTKNMASETCKTTKNDLTLILLES
jgi:hypothetical protein